ncbi:anti-sigma F factor [Posidoniimonas polymericola]|uniref:Anti-sigma F factor n=1 Tax=Posidoniimonas polymericola TaxID=2528002 RepID=A0A5C5YQ78_9BACT|nr:ATP-binding protein [Posidoniimonas polymericola]TWT77056.1 anti-sigma F factor [Posidoniimonas polymericola]
MGDNWAWTTEATLASQRGAHLPLMDEILAELKNHGWDGRDYFGVQMALEESLSNAIRHGNKLDEQKTVEVECKLSDQAFWIRIKDEGQGFQPEKVADCTTSEGLACHGGRGMMLINAYMTRVEHNEAGNCIIMEKTRDTDST